MSHARLDYTWAGRKIGTDRARGIMRPKASRPDPDAEQLRLIALLYDELAVVWIEPTHPSPRGA